MKRAFLAIAVILIALTVPASATVLDDFDQPIVGQGGSFGNVGAHAQITTTASGLGLGALGDWRTMDFHIDSVQGNPPNPSAPSTGGTDSAYINVTIPDYFLLDSSTYAHDSVRMIYDNNGAGLGADLSGYQTIRFQGAANSVATTWWLKIMANQFVSLSIGHVLPAGFAGDSDWPLEPYANFGIDLSNIYGVEIEIYPQTFGGDASLDAILAIPEPNAALIIAGLCGLGAVIRRVRGFFSA